MTWRPQPESTPDAMHPGSVVAGVKVCAYHADTTPGLRTAHGSAEGFELRVRQISGQCLDCQREQEEQ